MLASVGILYFGGLMRILNKEEIIPILEKNGYPLEVHNYHIAIAKAQHKQDMESCEPLKIACEGLLGFIREKFPDDFKEGGCGFICPHHKAIQKALSVL